MSPRRTRSRSRKATTAARSASSRACPATTLHPDDDIRAALDLFGAAQTDTLAVTARETGQVLGTLGEAFAARRYAQETDGAMKGVLGGG